MNARPWYVGLLLFVLVACSQPPTPIPVQTATPVPPTPTSVPPTAILVPPTATLAPTSTLTPTSTPMPPTSIPAPTATAIPPTSMITPTPGPTMPAGMGALLVTNKVGQYDINFTIDAKNYLAPMGGGTLMIYLSPGSHHFSVERNQSWSFKCERANNCIVEIVAGQVTQLSIDRSNYGF
jgi:hypothetical protein